MSLDTKTEDISKRSIRKRRRYLHQKRRQEKPVKDNSDLFGVENDATEYYFENGLRKVYPYSYTFASYVKGRWMGRTILDVFSKEFKSEETDVHEKNIVNGLLTVNGKKVTPDFVLGENQLLENTVHRHENPVLASPIEVIADTDDLLVVNKPASIPCHPCGRYKYNSLTSILQKEHNYKNLRILYRLDRMTSGVLIMPKTTTVSLKMETEVQKRRVQKEYLARVVGKFPDGEVTCNQPIAMLSQKPSMCKTDGSGKPSSTTFHRLSYNGTTSVVKCLPHTGRTHQIRVHLQFLGYPIVNDPLYNSPAFGESRGKGGIYHRSVSEIEAELWKLHNSGVWQTGENPLYWSKFPAGKDQPTDNGTTDREVIADLDGDHERAVQSVQAQSIDIDAPAAACDSGSVVTSDLHTSDMPGMDKSIDNDAPAAACDSGSVVKSDPHTSDMPGMDTSIDNDAPAAACDSGSVATSDLHTSDMPGMDKSIIDNVATMPDSDTVSSDIPVSNPDNQHMLATSVVVEDGDQSIIDANQTPETGGNEMADGIDSYTESSEQPPHKKAKICTPAGTEEAVEVPATRTCDNSVNDRVEESCVGTKGDPAVTTCLDIVLDIVEQSTSVCTSTCADVQSSTGPKTFLKPSSLPGLDESKVDIAEHCYGCQYRFYDPAPEEMVLYLHAVKYTGPDWEYSTALPDWAADDWVADS